LLVSALLAALAVSQPYPVAVDVSTSAPERGRYLTFTATVAASRDVEVIVMAATYVPGRGWSDWEELWRGSLRAGESRAVRGSRYVPSDAGAGSVVVWVLVQYTSGEDYSVIGGRYYYNTFSKVVVAGHLPDPDVEYWRERALYWMNQTRYWINQTRYWMNRTDYWRSLAAQRSEEAERLRRECEALRANLTALEARARELEARAAGLETEAAALRAEVASLRAAVSLASLVGVVLLALLIARGGRRERVLVAPGG